jgi:hypothetical protein
MILTVFIASALVGRMAAAPILAMTWALPVAVNSGFNFDTIVAALLVGWVVAAAGVFARLGYERLRPDSLTARA